MVRVELTGNRLEMVMTKTQGKSHRQGMFQIGIFQGSVPPNVPNPVKRQITGDLISHLEGRWQACFQRALLQKTHREAVQRQDPRLVQIGNALLSSRSLLMSQQCIACALLKTFPYLVSQLCCSGLCKGDCSDVIQRSPTG